MRELRLVVRVRNNLLAERREAERKTTRELAEAAGVSYWAYIRLEGMRESPIGRKGWRPVALAIASYFGEPPEALWPDSVLAVENPEVEARVDVADLLRHRLPDEPTPPDLALEERERRALVALALNREDARHRTVVLGRLEGRTLEDLGGELGVTKDRVSQLHARAVARMTIRVHRRLAGREP